MDQRHALITLSQTLASHRNVTHFAISMRALGKGDFFKRLIDGSDCRTATAARVLSWFSDNWPDQELEWPQHIPRPSKSKKEAT